MGEKIDCHSRRFSLNELSVRAERQIYKQICLQPNPTEISQQIITSAHNFSDSLDRPYLHAASSLLRCDSQKFVPQGSKLCKEKALNQIPKMFTINTLSFRQLEPLKAPSQSLPKIKKRNLQPNSQEVRELAWITPEEIMARKLKLAQKSLFKLPKEMSKVILEKSDQRGKLKGVKNDTINGWHIRETPQDFYE